MSLENRRKSLEEQATERSDSTTGRIYRFGRFRLDSVRSVLLKDGQAVALTPKVFETLLILVDNVGRMVPKDELIRTLWPDTFVEEGNLTYNISVLRKALGEWENGDHYIKTFPRKGYRFVAPVELVAPPGAPCREAAGHAPIGARWSPWVTTVLTLAGVLALWAGFQISRPAPAPRVIRTRQLTRDGREKSAEGYPVTDGLRVYFPESIVGPSQLMQVSVTGGEAEPVPTPWPIAALDLSPDGSEMLITGPLEPGPLEQRPHRGLLELFALPLPGGTPRRVGTVLMEAATWSADSRFIFYTQRNALYVSNSDGTAARQLLTAPGDIWEPRLSPDGRWVRFTVRQKPVPTVQAFSIWEANADGRNMHELLRGWNDPPGEHAGGWTPDGRYFVFQSVRNGTGSIWAIREDGGFLRRKAHKPIRLSEDGRSYYAPRLSKDGRTIFAVALEKRGVLVRYDSKDKEFVDWMGGISATWVVFSPDQQQVAYVKYPEETLWRMKADGSEKNQLTFSPTAVDSPAWSPDGTQIAFRAKKSGGVYGLYLVATRDGRIQELLPDRHQEVGVPTWSKDGRQIAFGDVPLIFGHAAGNEAIHLYDLSGRTLSDLPGSAGLWSARWSPDGRYVVALTISKQQLVLLERSTGKWRDLHVAEVANATWSHDSGHLVVDAPEPGSFNRGIYRVRIPDGKLEEVAALGRLRRAASWWSGLTPDDSPILLRDFGAQEIYALDVDWP